AARVPRHRGRVATRIALGVQAADIDRRARREAREISEAHSQRAPTQAPCDQAETYRANLWRFDLCRLAAATGHEQVAAQPRRDEAVAFPAQVDAEHAAERRRLGDGRLE